MKIISGETISPFLKIKQYSKIKHKTFQASKTQRERTRRSSDFAFEVGEQFLTLGNNQDTTGLIEKHFHETLKIVSEGYESDLFKQVEGRLIRCDKVTVFTNKGHPFKFLVPMTFVSNQIWQKIVKREYDRNSQL